MNIEEYIVRFENELRKVNRDGIEDLIKYCQKGDMYTTSQIYSFRNGCTILASRWSGRTLQV